MNEQKRTFKTIENYLIIISSNSSSVIALSQAALDSVLILH